MRRIGTGVADPKDPGKTIRRYPTAEERQRAAEALLKKVMLDSREIEQKTDHGP